MSTQDRVRTIVAQAEGTPLPRGSNPSMASRDIPKGHAFNARALRPLARTLFSSSVALGHAVAAYREFSRLKSSSVSPDGALGGRGYVMDIREIRAKMQEACELLSSVTDTLYDEINAPHWKPQISKLPSNEGEDISELVEEAEQVIADPESFGEKEIAEIESRNDGASQVPGAGGAQSTDAEAVKTASILQWKVSNSSYPVETLPGPRVDHLERGEQTGPGGSYNTDELPVDGWGIGERDGDYTSVFASSGVPDSNTDPTPTEANDFGLGYGAHGQASEGYGEKSPDGRGVAGPSSALPEDLGGKVRDEEEGANPLLNDFGRNVWATSEVPEGGLPARSDYYPSLKGNQFDTPVQGVDYNYDVDSPNVGYFLERQDVPYVKFDHNVYDYRTDTQDLYTYDGNKVGF